MRQGISRFRLNISQIFHTFFNESSRMSHIIRATKTRSERRLQMKKVVIGVAVLAVLSIGPFAFAHGPGWGGQMGYGNGGYMMGPGMMGQGYGGYMMGPGMMGQGYGGHMYGYTGGDNQKFLDETKDLRTELNEKQFEYTEAVRNPNTDEKTIEKLQKEITNLQDKITEKAPRTARAYGYGPCWQ